MPCARAPANAPASAFAPVASPRLPAPHARSPAAAPAAPWVMHTRRVQVVHVLPRRLRVRGLEVVHTPRSHIPQVRVPGIGHTWCHGESVTRCGHLRTVGRNHQGHGKHEEHRTDFLVACIPKNIFGVSHGPPQDCVCTRCASCVFACLPKGVPMRL